MSDTAILSNRKRKKSTESYFAAVFALLLHGRAGLQKPAQISSWSVAVTFESLVTWGPPSQMIESTKARELLATPQEASWDATQEQVSKPEKLGKFCDPTLLPWSRLTAITSLEVSAFLNFSGLVFSSRVSNLAMLVCGVWTAQVARI